jgi:basic amino acid/polyamine antiporter, APA family
MIALFFSYDGWEFLSWVGGEIKNPGRNLPLGLILGISLIVIAYLLANIVFLYALPPEVMAQQTAVADTAMTALFSHDAGRWVSLFIGVISFGAASVVVLGGARIYYSMALDGVFFAGMKRIHPRWKTPTTALLAQCAWVIVLILSGRYEQLYTCFIFMMTMTYALTVGAVFILRRTQPHRPRPYRCAGYLHRRVRRVRRLHAAEQARRIDHRLGDGRPRDSFVLVSPASASSDHIVGRYIACSGG